MLFRGLRLCFIAGMLCGFGHSQCNPTVAIQAELDAYSEVGHGQAPAAEKKAAQSQILEKALAAAPTDYFLLDRQRDLFDDNTSAGQEAAIWYFAGIHQKYPDSPGVTAVYADVLRVKDSAQALQLLESSEKAHPEFPLTLLKLVSALDWNNVQDKARISEAADNFLRACPSPLPTGYYSTRATKNRSAITPQHCGPDLKARLAR